MNRQITVRIDRAKLYLERICRDLSRNDPIQAMADAAELSEIARRLTIDFQAMLKEN